MYTKKRYKKLNKRYKGGLFTPRKSSVAISATNVCVNSCVKDAQSLCRRTCTNAVDATIQKGPIKEHSKIMVSVYKELQELRSTNKKLISDNIKLQNNIDDLEDELETPRTRRRRRR